MFTVYILYSFEHDKIYTGYTSNLIDRFHSHNSLGTTGWTCRYRPWIVIHAEIFFQKSAAMVREKELKSGKGRDWIKQNISDWMKPFEGSGSYPPRRT
jgi:putative endonuclease